MGLLCEVQLRGLGPWGKGQPTIEQQQQLEVDLSALPRKEASTFEDLKYYLENDLGFKAPSFSSSVQPVLGPLSLSPYGGTCKPRFYLTSDGSIFRDWSDNQYVPDNNLRVQLYAECTAAAMATAATARYPVLQVSAMSAEPQALEVTVKTLTGRAITLKVHEGTTVEHFKLMLQQHEAVTPDQQRLIYDGRQLEDACTMGDVAAQAKVPLDSFKPTFHLVVRLRGGMYHATSGRQDNQDLIEDKLQQEVTVLTYSGTELQLAVPTTAGPGGQQFGGKDLAQLALKTLEEETA